MEDEFLMFVALLFSMLLAQALPPGPLGPDWKYPTPRDGEVVRLIRTDDSLDFVVVAKQVCDCQPADAAAQLKTVLGKLDNVKVNVDDSPALAQRFDARSIPTLLLVKRGIVISRQVGAAPPHALRQWVDSSLSVPGGHG